jgi:peroxiredoxin
MIFSRTRASLTIAALAMTATQFAQANLQIGQAAPEFSLTDVNGKAVKLSDFKGKHVVLEWTNPNCPFVVKHYGSKNMQGLQSMYTNKGVVWLAVNSTAKNHQDYMEPTTLNAKMNAWGGKSSSTLMDADGKVGMAYGAKTTPHMYIVDPLGKLVYAGGIDDKRSANPADIPNSKNFVKAALDEALAGKAVSVATSTPYGCSVKYN